MKKPAKKLPPSLVDDLHALSGLQKRVQEESAELKLNRNPNKRKTRAKEWQKRRTISCAPEIIVHRLRNK